MALIVTTTTQLITPVYSPMVFNINSSTADYLELDIYTGDASKNRYDGIKRTLRIPYFDSSINVDVQSILQPFFASDAAVNPVVKRFDIVAKSFSNNIEVSTYVDNYYVFNGVNRGTWRDYEYIFDGSTGVTAKFLNNWNAPISVHLLTTENPKLYAFRGIFQNSTKKYDVSTATFKINVDGTNFAPGYVWTNVTEPQIYPIGLGAMAFSVTNYYTIDPSKNATTSSKVLIQRTEDDDRYTYKRVKWVDSNGCINQFNFDLAQKNEVDIDRTIFNNDGFYRQFATQAVDKYTIISNWITQAESEALKDLWYSPSVMVDGKYVTITNKSADILKRKDVPLINYVVNYEIATEYKIQRQ